MSGRSLPNLLNIWHQQFDQDAADGEYHQQLDEKEARVTRPIHDHDRLPKQDRLAN